MTHSKEQISSTDAKLGDRLLENPTPEAVTSMIRKIVSFEMPDELPSFDFEGPNIVNTLLSHDSSPKEVKGALSDEADHFANIMGGLAFIKLAAGTVAALLQLFQLLKKSATPPNEKEIVAVWRVRLIKAGLEERQAERIASRFYREALTVIGAK